MQSHLFQIPACPPISSRLCSATLPRLLAIALLGMPLLATASDHEETPSAKTLQKVEVIGTKLSQESSAGAGLRNAEAQVGALGERSLLDTPYSISVVDRILIENAQASALTDLLKYIPSAQMQARGGMEVGRAQTRGMQSSVVANNHLDGFNIAGTTAYPMELLERLEVIASLTGALYGPASPAGNFNFISKRPTESPLRRLHLGYGDENIFKIHTDLGGHIGANHSLGYRINLLHEEGDGNIPGSQLRRNLAGMSLDLKLADQTMLEINASHYEYDKYGYPGGFAYAANHKLPDAPDAALAGYGIVGAGLNLQTDTGSVLLKHNFNTDWQIAAGLSRQIVERGMTSPTHTLIDERGNYTTQIRVGTAGHFAINSNQMVLRGSTQTGALRHQLVFGTTGYTWDVLAAKAPSTPIKFGSASLQSPKLHRTQYWGTSGDRYLASSTRTQSLMLGDSVDINDRWSMLAMANYSWLRSDSYTSTGTRSGTSYGKGGLSLNGALMFKLRRDLTSYLAYADSLEQGDIAGTGATNEGEVLTPYRSKQWESGLKWSNEHFDVSAALFRIQRPFAYTDATDNVFRVQGLQVNRGLELNIGGDIGAGLFLRAGATLLNPILRDTPLTITRNQQVVGIPKVQANLLAEYQVEQLPGLVLSGNIHHTGRRAANDTNSAWVAGYTTLDLAARYSTQLLDRPATWRLGVTNITNKRYWASIFPGSTNGINSAASAFLGAPRSVQLGVSMDL